MTKARRNSNINYDRVRSPSPGDYQIPTIFKKLSDNPKSSFGVGRNQLNNFLRENPLPDR